MTILGKNMPQTFLTYDLNYISLSQSKWLSLEFV